MRILQVDDRVVVIPWANGSHYLVAERPLSEEQTRRLQRALISMKFLSGLVSGIVDEPTVSAIRAWAAYRARAEVYAFYRPALTENLLDTLGVLVLRVATN